MIRRAGAFCASNAPAPSVKRNDRLLIRCRRIRLSMLPLVSASPPVVVQRCVHSLASYPSCHENDHSRVRYRYSAELWNAAEWRKKEHPTMAAQRVYFPGGGGMLPLA